MEKRSIFRFLFRLASRAPGLRQQELLNRLVTGIANSYEAMCVRLYGGSPLAELASAEEHEDIELLEDAERARLDAMERELVVRCHESGRFRSARDIDPEGDLDTFLRDTIGGPDVFAFPIQQDGGARGVVLLYLSNDGVSLDEADVQAMAALGALIRLAGRPDGRPSAKSRARTPEPLGTPAR